MKEVIAGVDIGGTYTKFGLVTSTGELLAQHSINTNSKISYQLFFQELYDEISSLAKNFEPDFKIIGIGIGAPNGNYLTGNIDDASNLLWPGNIPVIEVMEGLSELPVILSNDANAAAVGELLFGAAKNLKHFVVITIGTGLGSGIIVNRELLLGQTGHAGEIGHTTVYYDGRPCACGKKGCLETYVSATGIVKTVRELLAGENRKTLSPDLKNENLDSKMITEAALQGDRIALEAFEYTGKILGMKLADTTAHLNPEAFIITGGLSNAGDLILNPARKYLDQHLMSFYKGSVRLLPSKINEKNSAILGSAALMWKHLGMKGKDASAGHVKASGT